MLREKYEANYIYLIATLMVFLGSGTFIITYFLTDPPRGITIWLISGLVAFCEFVAGLLMINFYLRKQQGTPVSVPAVAITGSVIGLYLVISLLTIFGYSVFRDPTGTLDFAFFGVMVSEIILFTIIGTSIYTHDVITQSKELEIDAGNIEHRRTGSHIRILIGRLRGLPNVQDNELAKLDVIEKKLTFIETALNQVYGYTSYNQEKPEYIRNLVGQLMEEVVNTDKLDNNSQAFTDRLNTIDALVTQVQIALRSYNLT